jgi:hypothetical protein
VANFLVQPVKELGQILVDHHALAQLDIRPCGLDRIVRTPVTVESRGCFR